MLVVAPPRWVTRTQGPVGGEHARDVAGLVASSTRRMRPAQPSTGQVVTSTAKAWLPTLTVGVGLGL